MQIVNCTINYTINILTRDLHRSSQAHSDLFGSARTQTASNENIDLLQWQFWIYLGNYKLFHISTCEVDFHKRVKKVIFHSLNTRSYIKCFNERPFKMQSNNGIPTNSTQVTRSRIHVEPIPKYGIKIECFVHDICLQGITYSV